MPVRDGRRRELGGLWPASENLQRRKSRERIRKAVPRALWRFGFCAWDGRSEPMGLSSTVDANDTRERGVSVILACSNRRRSTDVLQSKCRLRARAMCLRGRLNGTPHKARQKCRMLRCVPGGLPPLCFRDSGDPHCRPPCGRSTRHALGRSSQCCGSKCHAPSKAWSDQCRHDLSPNLDTQSCNRCPADRFRDARASSEARNESREPGLNLVLWRGFRYA